MYLCSISENDSTSTLVISGGKKLGKNVGIRWVQETLPDTNLFHCANAGTEPQNTWTPCDLCMICLMIGSHNPYAVHSLEYALCL